MVDLYTLVKKEIMRFLRVWKQSLIPPVVNTFLYLLIFGSFIGSQLKEINGVKYIDFIIPGLIMMAVISSSYMNTSFSFFVSKMHKNIEELFVSPISNLKILIGFVIGGMVRGFMVGFMVFILTLFFTEINIYSYFYFFLFLILTSILFSIGGLLNGIYAKTFDHINIIPTFIITPLVYLGGVFYSIGMLGGFWQEVSKINPILYMINGFRYGYIGVTDVDRYFSLGIIITLIFILSFWTYFLLKKAYGVRS